MLARVDIAHIDQLAARVLGENTAPGRNKQRVYDHVALNEMRQLLAELDDQRFEPDFLFEEWEQVILGQSIPTRSDYFKARRAGRGRALTRPERNHAWKLVEQFTARLDKLGVETWGQAAERAARFEIERASKIKARQEHKDEIGGKDLIHRDDSSGMRYLGHRYRHIVVDEAQDLRPAHWKMLRAMADPDLPNDMFIAGDTHQRIYDHQVALGALGINIRGRADRLTLSYRTTKEILAEALRVVDPKGKSGKVVYDDLDDGSDTLAGYRSVLHGPEPSLSQYDTWDKELAALGTTLRTWLGELSTDDSGAPATPAAASPCASPTARWSARPCTPWLRRPASHARNSPRTGPRGTVKSTSAPCIVSRASNTSAWPSSAPATASSPAPASSSATAPRTHPATSANSARPDPCSSSPPRGPETPFESAGTESPVHICRTHEERSPGPDTE